MTNYSEIKYKRNFLSQVLMRIDFLQFLPTEAVFCAEVEKLILKDFPFRGKDQKIQMGSIDLVIGNSPSASSTTMSGLQREYINGKNKILLANKYIIFEINEYSNFENHYGIICDILTEIFRKNQITTERIGIRYINILDSGKVKIRKNMFVPDVSEMLSSLSRKTSDNLSLRRALCLNEYRVSNMVLNFRYGLYNPDYPNEMKQNSMTLDYDCFITEPAETAKEVDEYIKKGHDAIQELFELSITENFRKVLNDEWLS